MYNWERTCRTYVCNFDRTLERTASFEPDKRSVVSLSHPDWPLITHRLMRRRLGIIVPLCAAGSESEKSSNETVLALLNVQIPCIYYVIDDCTRPPARFR